MTKSLILINSSINYELKEIPEAYLITNVVRIGISQCLSDNLVKHYAKVRQHKFNFYKSRNLCSVTIPARSLTYLNNRSNLRKRARNKNTFNYSLQLELEHFTHTARYLATYAKDGCM